VDSSPHARRGAARVYGRATLARTLYWLGRNEVTCMRRFATLLAMVTGLSLAFSAPLFAQERDKDGYFATGEGVRVKKVAFFNVKVYDIKSFTKELPTAKSKEAMINLDADKKLAWKMLRSVDAEKIRNALREAYAKNNYADSGKIESLLKPIASELKEGSWVTISYDAAAKKTTLYAEGQKATVDGSEFMKATWSIWFGNIDQPALSESLLQNMK
jgi:hypothetical protein